MKERLNIGDREIRDWDFRKRANLISPTSLTIAQILGAINLVRFHCFEALVVATLVTPLKAGHHL